MIAPVGICAEALTDELDAPHALIVQAHRETARCLMAHGDLVFARPSEREDLARTVAGIAGTSTEAAKAWEAVLTDGRWRAMTSPGPTPLCDIEEIDTLRCEWKNHIQLAIVETIRAEMFGCPDGTLGFIDAESGIEIATCAAQWQTETFSRLRDLASDHTVPGGTSRDELARVRFVPLLTGARHVSLLDRYLGEGIVRQYGDASSPLRSQELPWLLRLIDRYAEGASVSIFTTFDESSANSFTELDLTGAAEAMWAKCTFNGGVRQVNLFTAPVVQKLNGKQVRFPHDRHMRISSAGGVSSGFGLSAGFGKLRSPKTRRGSTWRLTYFWRPDDLNGLQSDEQEAKRLSGKHLQLT